MAQVVVIMGSASDAQVVQPCLEVLEELGIACKVTVSSAHRSPERTLKIVAEEREAKVFICAAGMAAHLAGAVAAATVRPVIGIPVLGQALAGMDALFSTVQMPAGFPVATVAINGAKNAAWLAAQILALEDRTLEGKLFEARKAMRAEVEKAAAQICKG